MEWIDVKNQLPKEDINVLVISRSKDIFIAYERDNEFRDINGDYYDLEEITHWCSLPDAPKEESSHPSLSE